MLRWDSPFKSVSLRAFDRHIARPATAIGSSYRLGDLNSPPPPQQDVAGGQIPQLNCRVKWKRLDLRHNDSRDVL